MSNKLLSVDLVAKEALALLERGLQYQYTEEGRFLRWDRDRTHMNTFIDTERSDPDTEYRYEEREGHYHLSQWSDAKTAKRHGEIAGRPDWLVNIIDMAKIGGYARRISQPPPDLIVWFTTDSKGNLVKFIEME